MQKHSHLQLAKALLNTYGGFSARRYDYAFLFGSFQPDCNPLSYLKGSLRCKTFGGHTYGNNRAFIEKRIHRLRRRDHWLLWQYYTLGKLSHYLSDAFTLPHNPHFPGRGWDHHVYETELRHRLDHLLTEKQPVERVPLADLPGEIHRLHEQYLSEEEFGVDTDLRYIFHANELLMASCRPVPLDLEEIGDRIAGELAPDYAVSRI